MREKKPIRCKRIFKAKYKVIGEVERFNATPIAKGYSQQGGDIDVQETFLHVIIMKTIRIMLTSATQKHWLIDKIDVYNTFLQGNLHEEIYMDLPQGFMSQGRNNQYAHF